jgi:hypothetical protein
MEGNRGGLKRLYDGRRSWRLEAWTIHLQAFSTITGKGRRVLVFCLWRRKESKLKKS